MKPPKGTKPKDGCAVCASATDTLTEAILNEDWWCLCDVILKACIFCRSFLSLLSDIWSSLFLYGIIAFESPSSTEDQTLSQAQPGMGCHWKPNRVEELSGPILLLSNSHGTESATRSWGKRNPLCHSQIHAKAGLKWDENSHTVKAVLWTQQKVGKPWYKAAQHVCSLPWAHVYQAGIPAAQGKQQRSRGDLAWKALKKNSEYLCTSVCPSLYRETPHMWGHGWPQALEPRLRDSSPRLLQTCHLRSTHPVTQLRPFHQLIWLGLEGDRNFGLSQTQQDQKQQPGVRQKFFRRTQWQHNRTRLAPSHTGALLVGQRRNAKSFTSTYWFPEKITS